MSDLANHALGAAISGAGQQSAASGQRPAAPAPFMVRCRLEPTKRNGLVKPMEFRIGAYHSIPDCLAAIREDKAEFPYDAASGHRTYAIYRAAWEFVGN